MESWPQNPEFRKNPDNFQPWGLTVSKVHENKIHSKNE